MNQKIPADWRRAGTVALGASRYAQLQPIPIRAVHMLPGFWQPRMKLNENRAIPRLLAMLEEHGVLDNFRRISGRKTCERRGPLFTDSDLFKWMEGAALALQSGDDPEIRESLASVIDEISAAQCADGYLNTWYVDERANDRFTNLRENHELYCAGHLFQAAVAHHRISGDMMLLEIACRYADYLCSLFGPGKTVQGHAGHPEIEMAIVELYRATGQKRYLDLAGYLLDHIGFVQQTELRGHAVRQMYLCAGGADYYMETGDERFGLINRALHRDLLGGKMYITGGVGSRFVGEAFGEPFELPNKRSYSETCGAIGNGMWNWRMLSATGEAIFADIVERVLYNGFLSGVSLAGTEFFYVNPLASSGGAERQPWYDVTCCPSNVVRTLAAIPGYVFSTSDRGLYVHLYDNCRLQWTLADGTAFKVKQSTLYPWDGRVDMDISPETPAVFELNLRIPAWCRDAKVEVNGEVVEARIQPGSYCCLSRRWQTGDKVVLTLPMPVEAIVADQRVAEDRSCVALMRGPVVYAFEGVDHPDIDLDRVSIPVDSETRRLKFTSAHEPGLAGGVTVLHGRGMEEMGDPGLLYTPLDEQADCETREVNLTAVPYYMWANRGDQSMNVWMRYRMV